MGEFTLDLLSAVGVPSAIAFFLLLKVNTTLERLTEAILKIDTKLDSWRTI